jgi:hypothetical protein
MFDLNNYQTAIFLTYQRHSRTIFCIFLYPVAGMEYHEWKLQLENDKSTQKARYNTILKIPIRINCLLIPKVGYFVRVSHEEVSVSHPDAVRKLLLAPLRKASPSDQPLMS